MPRRVAALVTAFALVLGLAACASRAPSASSDPLAVGMAAPFGTIDPAGPLASGSSTLQAQLFGRLLGIAPGGRTVKPDLASDARFSTPTAFTVTLRPGLRFANGHALTSSDVVFSITRLRSIKTPGGASALLAGVTGVEATDARTVVFHLTTANDQTIARTLTTAAGAVVDEQTFPSAGLADNASLARDQGFSGPYTIDSLHTRLITLDANPHYAGLLGAPHAAIALKSYATSTDMVRDLRDGVIDVADSGIGTADANALGDDDGFRVVQAPGSGLTAAAFDPAGMPYGAASGDPDPARALAVRQAIAATLDRSDIAASVHSGIVTPLLSYVPSSSGALTAVLATTTGVAADGTSDPDAPRRILVAAGVPTPVPLTLVHLADPISVAEFDAVTRRLQSSALFAVTASAVPTVIGDPSLFGLGQLVIDSAVSDPDPYLRQAAAWKGTGDAATTGLLVQQLSATDPAARAATLEAVQQTLTAGLWVVPLVQTRQVVAARSGIKGIFLDGGFVLRFAELRRS